MASRKEIIQAYLDLKKAPHTKVMRDDLLRHLGIYKETIYKHFGNWKNCKKECDQIYQEKLSPSQRALLSELNKEFDPDATKDDCINDLRRIQEENWGKHITRNFYRHHGKYADSTWSRHFGTFQEFRRQAGLELSRHQQKVEVAVARQASIEHYREY